MKCYNNFNDMFNAQVNNGARMSVFNVVAEASVLKDMADSELPYVVRISTKGKDDFVVLVAKKGSNDFTKLDSIPVASKTRTKLTEAGIDDVISTLTAYLTTIRTKGYTDKKTGKPVPPQPNFDTTSLSDAGLQNLLNSASKKVGITWGGVGYSTESTSTPKSATTIPDGVRATGIIKDKGKKAKIYKFGFAHDTPYAELYDTTGTKLDDVRLDKLFSPGYVRYLNSGAEDLAKRKESEFARQLEVRFTSGDKARKLDEVYWLPGDVDCGDMEKRLTSDLKARQDQLDDEEAEDDAVATRVTAEEFAKRGLLSRWVSGATKMVKTAAKKLKK